MYVRQSSPQQVLQNRESTARQYALAQYAQALGWPAERVLVIDEDQGQSGKTADNRAGFQRLLAEVTMEHAGIVLGLEMSRLARSSKDWHHLFELCGIFGTLLADQEGVYEANDPNDRLILGLKGIMSEVELQTMRNRLDRGRLNKAQRGAMFHGVPTGYVILPTGEVDFDPDEQAREVVHLIFDKFDELASIYGLFHWLIRHDIRVPVRARTGAKKRLKRARYDVELAERRYQSVDPENRLVAATLEKRWEELLLDERQVQDEYDRFLRQTPAQLSDDERAHIEALASNIPTLWNAAGTTNADRKQIIRCVVQRVAVHVRCDREFVDVTIRWAGGYESQHEIIRPVATYAQLRDFEQLMNRVVELREAGHTAPRIAERLNAEGFYPPKRRGQFTTPVVYQLLKRRALIGNERSHSELLAAGEWWLTDLARELKMSHLKLRDWASRGWVHSRKTPVQGYRILWADPDEVTRLRELLAQSRRGVNAYTSELKTPKKRADQS